MFRRFGYVIKSMCLTIGSLEFREIVDILCCFCYEMFLKTNLAYKIKSGYLFGANFRFTVLGQQC